MSDILLEGKIIAIPKQEKRLVQEKEQLYQQLKVEILKGELSGQIITLENGHLPTVKQNQYRQGELVMVGATDLANEQTYYLADYIRRDGLSVLAVIFLVMVLLVTRKQGFLAILGMILTFGIVFK